MNFDEWLEQEGPLFARIGMLPVERRQMKRAWDVATKSEREECAKLCEDIGGDDASISEGRGGGWCADAIRMRSNAGNHGPA